MYMYTHRIIVFRQTGVHAVDRLEDLESVLVTILRHQKFRTLRKETETRDAYQRRYSAERQKHSPGIVHEGAIPKCDQPRLWYH